MIEPKIYIAKATKNVMTDFEGVFYQAADGVEAIGQPRVYTEE